MRHIILFLALAFVSGCTDTNKEDINHLLNERNISINQKNAVHYATLLEDHYFQEVGLEKIAQLKNIFQHFDKVKMTTRDRELRILDDKHAICEQTYILKVFADHQWREIVQREQLTFTLVDGQWKISGGL